MSKALRAVILDWAGTTVDHGSLAPVRTLQRVFEEFRLPITEAEARRDMGIAKRDHIAAILAMPRVAEQWQHVRGKPPGEADLDKLYARFIPLQFSCLEEYSDVFAEVPAAVANLRRRNLKIGSTTGYTREMLELLLKKAASQGYAPDCSLTPEDVGAGRPHPFMIYQAAVRLGAYPLSAFVKVGDTPSDVQEGLNAGAWTVGVTRTGNTVGLSHSEWNALTPEDQAAKLRSAEQVLRSAGAHYVIRDLSELDAVLDQIEAA